MPELEKEGERSAWKPLQGPALGVLIPSVLLVAIGIVGAQNAPADQKVFYDNLHWTASYIAAACLAWVGVRYTPGPNQVKRWFAAGLTVYAFGQVLWDFQVAKRNNPFPYYSDLFFVMLAPMYAYGILRYIRRSKVELRAALLDIAGLSIAFLSLTLAIYVPRQQDQSLLQMAVLIAYPVGYFVATAAVLVAVLTVQVKPHIGWILSLSALTLNTVLWLRWNVDSLNHKLASGSIFNAMFSVSALALGCGAMCLKGELAAPGRWTRICQAILRLLPLFTVAACAIAVVVTSLFPFLHTIIRQAVLPGFVIALVLAAIRQSISLTEREWLLRAERQLRAIEGRNKLIIETALDAVISIGPSGHITEWNPVAEKMFGYSRQEAIDSTVAALIVPPHLRPAHEAGLERYLTTRQAKLLGTTFEIEAMRKGGEIFQIEISVNVIESAQGPFFSAFIRDMTKRNEDEQKRLSLEAQLRHSQKMEAVGTLAAGIAHDFNNVLAAIRGNADLAANDLALDHPARNSVDEIRRAGLRATHLVQQIVAFSRREKSTNVQPTNLAEVAYEVTRLLRSTLPPTIDITVQAEDDLPEVLADSGQMHQVLVNLYTNAWHAIGSRPGKIAVTLERIPGMANWVRLVVRDDGSGMSAEVAERIFEPFYTTKRLGEGTGLGLSVVHNIIENHGGRIFVNSREDVGTEMIVELPTPTSGVSSDGTSSGVPTSTPMTASLAYIDDEDSLLLLVRRSLTRRGHTVTGYLSAQVAIEEILGEPDRFDLVVTDLNMPEMSGLDVARALRAELPNLPILLTSGFVSDQILQDAEAVGITRVLEKPSTLDELSAAIQEVLHELAAQRTLK